jgi:hypothetical protein
MKISNWFTRDGAERPLIWPCVTLVLLFVLDLWVNPHFLSLRVLDGHLFGAPIDILNPHAASIFPWALWWRLPVRQRPRSWLRSRFRAQG